MVPVVVVRVSVLEIDRPGVSNLSRRRVDVSARKLRGITAAAAADIPNALIGGLVAQRLDQIQWRVDRIAVTNQQQAHFPSVSASR